MEDLDIEELEGAEFYQLVHKDETVEELSKKYLAWLSLAFLESMTIR